MPRAVVIFSVIGFKPVFVSQNPIGKFFKPSLNSRKCLLIHKPEVIKNCNSVEKILHFDEIYEPYSASLAYTRYRLRVSGVGGYIGLGIYKPIVKLAVCVFGVFSAADIKLGKS